MKAPDFPNVETGVVKTASHSFPNLEVKKRTAVEIQSNQSTVPVDLPGYAPSHPEIT
jgi:hypothetical protein